MSGSCFLSVVVRCKNKIKIISNTGLSRRFPLFTGGCGQHTSNVLFRKGFQKLTHLFSVPHCACNGINNHKTSWRILCLKIRPVRIECINPLLRSFFEARIQDHRHTLTPLCFGNLETALLNISWYQQCSSISNTHNDNAFLPPSPLYMRQKKRIQ